MTKYRKKPVVIEATQWFKNGDHPQDQATEMFDYPSGPEHDAAVFTRPQAIREGEVVRYYRHPEVAGDQLCKHCSGIMHNHGWIDTLEGGHIVCPGDWIITGVQGERYPCKPDIFAATYEPASSPARMTDDHSSVEAVKILIMLRETFQHWIAIGSNKQPHYPNGLRPWGNGDLAHIVEQIATAEAALAPLPTPTDQDKLVGELVDGEANGLTHNLALRDRFIVEHDLWSAFLDQCLPATRARQSGSAEQ